MTLLSRWYRDSQSRWRLLRSTSRTRLEPWRWCTATHCTRRWRYDTTYTRWRHYHIRDDGATTGTLAEFISLLFQLIA